VLGIALFGLIVLHGGLCPHMKIETVLNLIVVERGSVHVVIVVEQVRRMWRVTPFIREDDEIGGDSPVDGWRAWRGRR